ncbi:hypothetical protein GALL_364390 [mine drainage metagenome]|uniref:SdpI family protein n=1 Tax=mine drainage metagenome TaxID=410659 RepID=A0A1J5R0U7_9ZZZZ
MHDDRLATIAWSFTALLLVSVAICRLAGRGTIVPNGFVGIRIPSVMYSDAAWKAGHAAAVVPAVCGFGSAAVCSIAGLVLPVAYWGAIIAFIGAISWMVVAANRAAGTP